MYKMYLIKNNYYLMLQKYTFLITNTLHLEKYNIKISLTLRAILNTSLHCV